MTFVYCNPNPDRLLVGDCVIRAISILKDQSWLETYDDVTCLGREMYDMPSSNAVWNSYLIKSGFTRSSLPNTCPECYKVSDFCWDHPVGLYLLATGTHVIAVIDGDYYDTWDSGDEIPIYFYERR